MAFEQAIIVRSKTRLEQLVERFNTKAQAKFYIEHSGMNFQIFEDEHEVFYAAFEKLNELVSVFKRYKVLERSYLPNYIFAPSDIIFVIGQDGLVANTAKYVKGQPIVAINPDEKSYDGILLPFNLSSVQAIIAKINKGNYSTKAVTMAKAEFNDGQTLLAFNDFFLGPKSHTSARYILKLGKREEQQSSSGIIISTGAGSTGWMSSVFNMVSGVNIFHNGLGLNEQKMDWGSNNLIFAVREPFISKTSKASLSYGHIEPSQSLIVESLMPDNGIVFSDGIEADAIKFNSGSKVKFSRANEKANLVMNS